MVDRGMASSEGIESRTWIGLGGLVGTSDCLLSVSLSQLEQKQGAELMAQFNFRYGQCRQSTQAQ